MTQIDSFTLQNKMGHRIHGSVCRDGSEYVLNAGHLAQNKRFKSLEALYGFCDGMGWDLAGGQDRAAAVRRKERTVTRARTKQHNDPKFAEEFRKAASKGGYKVGNLEVR